MKPFLLEIGCEELPAASSGPRRTAWRRRSKRAWLPSASAAATCRVYGTPRRLAVLIDDVEEKQQESVTVKFGPPADRAFDGQGKPLPPATGVRPVPRRRRLGAEGPAERGGRPHLRGKGGKRQPDSGGARRFSSRRHRPHPFSEEDALGRGTFEFGRPVHWIVALFGDEVIHFNAAGGYRAGTHRWGTASCRPALLVITDVSRYLEEMRARYVIVDDAERMQMMKAAIRAIEAKTGAMAVADAGPPGRDLLHHGISPRPHGRLRRSLPGAAPGRARQRHERASALHPAGESRTARSSPPSSSLPTRFRPIPPR